jgi:hypothetical protein
VAKVLLATPTHDGVVTVAYTESLLTTTRALQDTIDLRPMFIGATLVAHARNAFATMVLEDPSFTHLLFVDSDMGFGADAVRRMVECSKDFVGCIAPRRSIDLDRMHSISRQVDDPLRARMIAQDYAAPALVPRDLGGGKMGVVVEDGLAQAHQVGMGLTLLKRSVLERMRDAYPDLEAPANWRYKAMGVRDRVFQVFESTQNPDGIYLSEDFSFCERWRRIGGEIWVYVDEVITHVGRKAFQGRYIERLAFESSGPPHPR